MRETTYQLVINFTLDLSVGDPSICVVSHQFTATTPLGLSWMRVFYTDKAALRILK